MAAASPAPSAKDLITHTPDGRKLPRPYYRINFNSRVFEVDTRYQNLCPIGKGAYGLVCSAEDTLTGRKVAIKKITDVFQDLIDAKRILREIKLLRHLGSHDNIIDVYDIMTGPPETEDFRSLYMVTELFECDLDRIISSSQRLTDSHVQYFLYQLLRGLKYMHSANVLHRDLKPPNLLVKSNCDLAICDFGLSRGVSDEMDGKLTEYVVTRWYRAPELLCEFDSYGPAVDVWSAGCIFGEILGRRPLFQGDSTPKQLDLIIRLIGTPSEEECPPGSHARKEIQKLPKYPPADFEARFPGANPLALDLLKKLLTFHPDKRITVDDALAHSYLHELHSRADEPVCSTKFNFDFEKAYGEEIPMDVLQRFMYKEMVGIRADRAAEIRSGK